VGWFASLAGLMILISMLSTGYTAIYSIVITGFFISIMFATIYSLAIEGLERFTNEATSPTAKEDKIVTNFTTEKCHPGRPEPHPLPCMPLGANCQLPTAYCVVLFHPDLTQEFYILNVLVIILI